MSEARRQAMADQIEASQQHPGQRLMREGQSRSNRSRPPGWDDQYGAVPFRSSTRGPDYGNVSFADMYPQQETPHQIAAPARFMSADGTETYEDFVKRRADEIEEAQAAGGVGQGATASEIEDYVRSNYGYMGAFLNIPEVAAVLYNAAREGWDSAKLYGALNKTSWWQNTSAAQRTWTRITSEDPAEARRLVDARAAGLVNRARTLGVTIGDIAGLALQIEKNGYTDEQIIDELIKQTNWNTIAPGDLTATRDTVHAIAGDYLVHITDATSQRYAERIASGEMSMQGVRSAMLDQAKTRFWWMSSQLDQGMTVKDYLAPVRDTIARELELAPEAVDLMDSRWMSMIERDDGNGNIRSATLNEAMLEARKQPEWQHTRNAQETTTSMANMVTNIFGRSGV